MRKANTTFRPRCKRSVVERKLSRARVDVIGYSPGICKAAGQCTFVEMWMNILSLLFFVNSLHGT